MNTNTLKMFITIAQTGSITATAKNLGYAQSNISAKLHQLEADLDVQLVHRNNRGITLTNAGQKLLQQAVQIVSLTEQTVADLQHPQTVQGQLHLGALQTAATSFLPELLAAYHTAYPNVQLVVTTGTTAASLAKIRDYELAGAIVAGTFDQTNLTVIPLAKEKLCLISAPGDDDQLLRKPLLVFPEGCAYRQTLMGWLSSEQMMLRQAIEFDNLTAMIANVSAGLGISLLPRRVVQSYFTTGALTELALPAAFATVPLAFVYRQDTLVDPALAQFITQLRAFFKTNRQW